MSVDQSQVAALRPAAGAFDAIAGIFDARFAPWQSVAAQRRAMRRSLTQNFAPHSHILELGGGTGDDAAWLAAQGHDVVLTDASPAMVGMAREKLAPLGASAEVVAAEDLEHFALRHFETGGKRFDGAFSNFAPLNCVEDLKPVGRGLARLLHPGAAAMLMLFGTFCPGEFLTETIRGRPRAALRRLKRGPAPARLAKREFTVVYHRRADLVHALAPWFVLEQVLGVGVFVPPSAAEPWISGHPHLLSVLERLDGLAAGVLAPLGDHVLYRFRRTDIPAP